MWQSTDYRDKYGPMLYLLNSEQDYEYLATKAGYREEIAHDYRDVQRRSLRAYLLDLEADINELREAAAPVALGNAEIARSVEHNLRMFSSVSRYVRFRLAFDRFIPAPKPKGRPGLGPALRELVRKTMISLVPRPSAPNDLLASMNDLRDALLGRNR